MTIEDQSRAKRDALAALQAKMNPPHQPQGTAERARMSNKMMNLRREIQTLDTEKDEAAQKLLVGLVVFQTGT
jgi:hypothetical protein